MSNLIEDRTQQEKYEHAKLKLIDAYRAFQELTDENKLKLAQEAVGAPILKEFLNFLPKR